MTDDIERFQKNLQHEVNGAALYTALAGAESDPVRKDLFLQLAKSEATHAQFWRNKLAAAGVEQPSRVPDFRTRILARLARRFGPRFVLPTIAAAEYADRDKYARQPDAQALSAEERGHAAIVHAVAGSSGKSIGVTGGEIASAEPWHRGGSGNNLRAAVLGANDGLVSNFCLIMGVAGAGSAERTLLLTGFAGLLAGACSMALGEWLSVTNARELAQTQIGKEAEELEQTPEAEQHELALIFQAKGLPKEDAQRVAGTLMRDKKSALDTLAREELGIDPAELGGKRLGRRWDLLCSVCGRGNLPNPPLPLAEGSDGGCREHSCQRACFGSHRDADVVVQRQRRDLLRRATGDLRVRRCRDYLLARTTVGRIVFVTVRSNADV